MNITICDRCNVQLQIPLIDEINLRQHQESNSCKDGHANGASDLFVLEQVNARGMGITTTIYKRNAAMCST